MRGTRRARRLSRCRVGSAVTIFVDAFVAIRTFFEAGGNVLWGILGVTTLMWTFIIERLWFFQGELPRRVKRIQADWERSSSSSGSA